MMSREVYCRNCGTVGKYKKRVRGWFALELLLWLMFIVPGFCYSIWRLSSKDKVCAACGSEAILPADSPQAQRLIASADTRPTAGTAPQFASTRNP
jgi:hypothetical protein